MVDRRFPFYALLGVIPLLSAACGGSSRTGGGECSDGTCVEGDAASAASCRTRLDCPDGESCNGGFCGPEVPGRPTGDPGGAGCTTSLQCGGLVCVEGRCLECAEDSDCGLGGTCRSHQCVNPQEGGPLCTDQRDCDRYGTLCNTVASRCEPCANDAQCGAAKDCVDGTCRAPAGDESGGGTTGGESGSSCGSRSDCSGNQACWLGRCSPCYNDVMCTDTNDIFSGPMICDVQTGQCGSAECINASECAPGQGCWGNGHCGECTTDATCRQGEDCNDGVCQAPGASTPPGGSPPGDPPSGSGGLTLGDSCDPATSGCGAGAACFTVGGVSRCTRACVGNGKGGADDCPTGMACMDFSAGAYDGAKLCLTPDQLMVGTPGAPFTTPPGGACTSVNNGCQTSFCQSGGTCARACMANRDCATGEVCFAVVNGDNESSGYHTCVASDTNTYKPAGEACSTNLECDSGVCTGTCANHCRTLSDCSVGETCLPWATYRNGAESRDWTPVCRSGSGGAFANGAACAVDGDCASWWCIGGTCTEPCGSNLDCTGALAAKACGPVTFTDTSGTPTYSMSFCVY